MEEDEKAAGSAGHHCRVRAVRAGGAQAGGGGGWRLSVMKEDEGGEGSAVRRARRMRTGSGPDGHTSPATYITRSRLAASVILAPRRLFSPGSR
ncbi:hypothetical protein GDO81_007623 [Engystomops pustulosus]|uniref:Uncharacterized protein n=1 Tax=Engystomops pustulosus TaxID=76066 RepID=A0AAV7C8F4_ENGPU|nr:hypothetical protein GDO81_007623 [Engystomops pustulosus]